jgi:hypothetical protein
VTYATANRRHSPTDCHTEGQRIVAFVLFEPPFVRHPSVRDRTPDLALRVFSADAKLFVQGTNQGRIEIASVDKDIFIAKSVAAEIDFERDTSGKVIALPLSNADGSCAVSGIEPRHAGGRASMTSRA